MQKTTTALPNASPASANLSPTRLGHLTTALRTHVEANQLPGAVIAIARHGQLVFHEAVGHLGPDHSTPMPKDAIFAIASMTKPITGVAALILLEEGHLTLSDPVERFLPHLAAPRVAVSPHTVTNHPAHIETTAAHRPVTILDLMRHTSGLTYGGRGITAAHALYPASSNIAGATLDKTEFLHRIAAAPLLHQPGTVWEYGLSIDILGLIVEEISGQSLGAFLDQRLFRPLGMTDTSFQVPAEKAVRLARPLP